MRPLPDVLDWGHPAWNKPTVYRMQPLQFGPFSRLSCQCPVGVKFLSLAVGACSLEPRDESFVTENQPFCKPEAALADLKKLATSWTSCASPTALVLETFCGCLESIIQLDLLEMTLRNANLNRAKMFIQLQERLLAQRTDVQHGTLGFLQAWSMKLILVSHSIQIVSLWTWTIPVVSSLKPFVGLANGCWPQLCSEKWGSGWPEVLQILLGCRACWSAMEEFFSRSRHRFLHDLHNINEGGKGWVHRKQNVVISLPRMEWGI